MLRFILLVSVTSPKHQKRIDLAELAGFSGRPRLRRHLRGSDRSGTRQVTRGRRGRERSGEPAMNVVARKSLRNASPQYSAAAVHSSA